MVVKLTMAILLLLHQNLLIDQLFRFKLGVEVVAIIILMVIIMAIRLVAMAVIQFIIEVAI